MFNKHHEITRRHETQRYAKMGYKICGIDTDLYIKYNWWDGRAKGYMFSQYKDENDKIINIFIHRMIAERFLGKIPEGHEVDHIDRDRKNNCRENLRIVPRSLNRFNRLTDREVRGVEKVRRTRDYVYRAEIKHLDVKYHGPTRATIEEAIADRKAFELKFFGEYSPEHQQS